MCLKNYTYENNEKTLNSILCHRVLATIRQMLRNTNQTCNNLVVKNKKSYHTWAQYWSFLY